MAGKNIVIIGGGIGGIVLANALRENLDEIHRVVVIEKTEAHAFAASLLWMMVGQRDRRGVTRPVRRLLRPNVELLIGEATEVDASNQLVRAGSDSIPYDFLVLASGAELSFDGVPGLATAETFYTLDGADRLHSKLSALSGGRVAIVIASTPYKCPGAPAEAAMLIQEFLRQRGIRGQVALYSPEPQPMPVAGPALGEAVIGMLTERGIGYHPGHTLRGIELGNLSFEGRDSVSADLVVAVPRHLPPAILRTAGIANETGWAASDPRTLATKDPSIFAIGDCASIPLPGRWNPNVPLLLPKAGVFAHAQALTVAGRIVATIHGHERLPEFGGHGFCVLEAGRHRAGFAYGDFFATPSPELHLRNVGRLWHASKVLFEQWWLASPGLRKGALGGLLRTGGRLSAIPVEL